MIDTLPAFWAVIPAAGVGARMAADRPKQYLELAGRTLLEHSLDCFLGHPALNGVVAFVLMRAGRKHNSITLTADGKHLLTDVWTSVGVVVGVVARLGARLVVWGHQVRAVS